MEIISLQFYFQQLSPRFAELPRTLQALDYKIPSHAPELSAEMGARHREGQ